MCSQGKVTSCCRTQVFHNTSSSSGSNAESLPLFQRKQPAKSRPIVSAYIGTAMKTHNAAALQVAIQPVLSRQVYSRKSQTCSPFYTLSSAQRSLLKKTCPVGQPWSPVRALVRRGRHTASLTCFRSCLTVDRRRSRYRI
jgi:hypothetical protein